MALVAKRQNGGDSHEQVGGEPRSEVLPSPRAGLTLGFAVVGLVVVVLAGLSTRISRIPLTAEFGLLQLLPFTYWIGLSLMGLAVVLALRERSGALIAVTGVLFFAMFAGTPLIFEPYPRYWDAYIHLSSAQEISLFGQLPTSPELYSANWPGFFILVQLLSALGAVGPLQMLAIFPFITGGLTFLALFVFLRTFFPPPIPAIGSLLGSLLNVWAQFHLSPQSIGLWLALLVLATAWQRRISWRTTNAILFVALVIIHPTSTILLLGIFIADVTLAHIGRRGGSPSTASSEGDLRFVHSPALPFAVLWVGWLFFQARGSAQVAETAILTRMGAILQIPEQTLSVATARSLENIFLIASSVRLASLLIYGIIGVVALILLSRGTKYRRRTQFLWAALVGLALFGMADILAFQGLLYDRSFAMFAILIPAICLAGIGTLRMRKRARSSFIAVLLVASLASASTTYYQEAFNFVSDESVAVSEFLERVAPGSLVLDGLFPEPVWLDTEARTPRSDRGFYEVYPTAFEDFGGDFVYAVFDPTAELWYMQWRGIDIYRFYEGNRSDYSLIYANGQMDISLIKSLTPGE